MNNDNKVRSYDDLLKNVQKYLPFLRNLINHLQNEENPREGKITQMYEMLTTQRLKYDNLLKCETILVKLYDSKPLENQSTDNVGSTSLKPVLEKSSLSYNKQDETTKQTNLDKITDKLQKNVERNSSLLDNDTVSEIDMTSLKKAALLHKAAAKKVEIPNTRPISPVVDVLKSPPLSIDDIKKLITENSDNQSSTSSGKKDNLSQAIKDSIDVLSKSFSGKTDKPVEETRLAFKYNPHPKKSTEPEVGQKISTTYDLQNTGQPIKPHITQPTFPTYPQNHVPRPNFPQHHQTPHVMQRPPHHLSLPHHQQPHPINPYHGRPPVFHQQHSPVTPAPFVNRRFPLPHSAFEGHHLHNEPHFDRFIQPPHLASPPQMSPEALRFNNFDQSPHQHPRPLYQQQRNFELPPPTIRNFDHPHLNAKSFEQSPPQNLSNMRQFEKSNPQTQRHYEPLHPPPQPPILHSPSESPTSILGATNMPTHNVKDPRLRKTNPSLNQVSDEPSIQSPTDKNLKDQPPEVPSYRPPDNIYFTPKQVQIDPRLKRLNSSSSTSPSQTTSNSRSFPQRRMSVGAPQDEVSPSQTIPNNRESGPFPQRRMSVCAPQEEPPVPNNPEERKFPQRRMSVCAPQEEKPAPRRPMQERRKSVCSYNEDLDYKPPKNSYSNNENNKKQTFNRNEDFNRVKKKPSFESELKKSSKYDRPASYRDKGREKDRNRNSKERESSESKNKNSPLTTQSDKPAKSSQFDKLYRTGDFAKSLPILGKSTSTISFKIPKIKKVTSEIEQKLDDKVDEDTDKAIIDKKPETKMKDGSKKKDDKEKRKKKIAPDNEKDDVKTKSSKNKSIIDEVDVDSIGETSKKRKTKRKSVFFYTDIDDDDESIEDKITSLDKKSAKKDDAIIDPLEHVTGDSNETIDVTDLVVIDEFIAKDDESSENIVSSSTDTKKKQARRKSISKADTGATTDTTTEVKKNRKQKTSISESVTQSQKEPKDEYPKEEPIEEECKEEKPILEDEAEENVTIVVEVKEDEESEAKDTHELLQSVLSKTSNPDSKMAILEMLGKLLDEKKFKQIQEIIDSPNIDEETIDEDVEKSKEVEPLPEPNEKEKEVTEINPEVSTGIKKPRKKHKNELDKLNDDIREMFISDGVMNAVGRRRCTINTNYNEQVPKSTAKPSNPEDGKPEEESVDEEKIETPKIGLKNLQIVMDKVSPKKKKRRLSKRLGLVKRKSKPKVTEEETADEESENEAESVVDENDETNIEKEIEQEKVVADELPMKVRKKPGPAKGWKIKKAMEEAARESEISKAEKAKINDESESDSDLIKPSKKTKHSDTIEEIPDDSSDTASLTEFEPKPKKTKKKLLKKKDEIADDISETTSIAESEPRSKTKKSLKRTVEQEEECIDDVSETTSIAGSESTPPVKRKKKSAWASGEIPKRKKKVASPAGKMIKHHRKEVHSQSNFLKECVLCPFNGSSMVLHYIRKHPSEEIFISRFPPELSKKIKADPFRIIGELIPTKGFFYRIQFNCYFCGEDKEFIKHEWKQHLATHTGEYRYKCKNCTVMSQLPLISKTTYHDKDCGGASMVLINKFDYQKNHIYAYMCKICDYVQIQRDSIEKHVKAEHNKSSSSVLKFSILNYEEEEAEEEEDKQKDDSDVSMPDLVPQEPSPVQKSAFLPSNTDEVESLRILHGFESPEKRKSSIADKSCRRFSTSVEKESLFNFNEIVLEKENNRIRTTRSGTAIQTPNLDEEEEVDPLADADNSTQADDDEWEDVDTEKQKRKKKDKDTASDRNRSTITDTANRSSKGLAFKMPTPLGIKKEEPQDIFENKLAIQNVGYSFVNDQVWYLCLFEECKFSTNIRVDIYNHMKDSHSDSTWNGYCEQCSVQVKTSTDVLDLMAEIRHMMIVHVKNRRSQDVDDKKPVLKFRRLSGDKLSSLTELQGNEVDTMSKIRTIVAAQYNNAANLPVEKENIVFENNADVQLKPWTNQATCKTMAHRKNLLEERSLYCLFKCMGKTCCYTTTDESQMGKHLKNHDLVGEPYDASSAICYNSWLECAYCPEVADDLKKLVSHIVEVHGKSPYQCPYCFYRCRDPYGVDLHLDAHHKGLPKKILVIKDDEIKALKKVDKTYLEKKRIENVAPLICVVCKLQFYVLDYYMSHLMSHDLPLISCQVCGEKQLKQKMAKHLLSHSIGIYECVYCRFGTNLMANIQGHVCNNHPSEYLWACVRYNKKSESQLSLGQHNIEATALTPIDSTVKPEMYQYCKYSKDELNYKSVDTKSNFDINYTNKPLGELKITNIQSLNITATTSNVPILNQLENFVKQPQPIPVQRPIQVKVTLAPNQSTINRRRESLSVSNTSSTSTVAPKLPVISAVHGAEILSKMPVITSVQGSYTDPIRMPVITNITGADSSLPIITKVHSEPPTKIPVISNVCSMNTSSENLAEKTTTTPTLAKTASPEKRLSVLDDNLTFDEIDRIADEMINKSGDFGENLFRCSIHQCSAKSQNSQSFNAHLLTHRKLSEVKCFHCKDKFPTIAALLSHIKNHGRHRFFCFLCDLKHPLLNYVISHINAVHKVSKTKMVFLNPKRNDRDRDIVIVCPATVTNPEMKNYYKKFVEIYKHKKMIALIEKKTHYNPDEIDLLPVQAIFSQAVTCAKCNYSTKVKVNMVRHLKSHLGDRPVAMVDPKNPVPCLETNQKHFDKMKNMAYSSCQDDELTFKLNYVPESKRYVCGAKDCKYLTINENMLKCHLTTLHTGEEDYKCPHCSELINNGIMCTDTIFDHLKCHDIKLFKCSFCSYYMNTQVAVEKHIKEQHTQVSTATVVVVRDEIQPGSGSAGTKESDNSFDKWECDICKYKSETKFQMRSHMEEKHSLKSQYQCAKCKYMCSNKHFFTDHFEKKHSSTDIIIISLYHKIGEEKEKEVQSNTPLWTRDNTRTKHIRGIYFDEQEDDEDEDDNENLEIDTTIVEDNMDLQEIFQNLDTSILENVLSTGSKRATEEPQPGNSKKQKVDETPFDDDNDLLEEMVKNFKCGFKNCGYTNAFVSGIKAHFKTEHPNAKAVVLKNKNNGKDVALVMDNNPIDVGIRYHCNYCQKKCDTIPAIRTHWGACHREHKVYSNSVTVPPKPFQFKLAKLIKCFYCTKTSTLPDLKKRHHPASHPGKKFVCIDVVNDRKCGECDFTAHRSIAEIKQHYLSAHNTTEQSVGEANKEGECDYVSTELLNHILKTGSIKYTCRHCTSYECWEVSDIVNHCSCEHPFKNVNYSTNISDNSVKYECFCIKNDKKNTLFNSEFELTKHVRTHVAPYICTYCPRDFKMLHYLKQHLDIMHKKTILTYKEKELAETLSVFKKTKIVFWNGLVLTREEAAATKYGELDNIREHLNEMKESEQKSV